MRLNGMEVDNNFVFSNSKTHTEQLLADTTLLLTSTPESGVYERVFKWCSFSPEELNISFVCKQIFPFKQVHQSFE